MNAVWALLHNRVNPTDHPGPPYWFRERREAQEFAWNNNKIYTHLPKLMAVRFPVWPRGTCTFNPATYTGQILIVEMEMGWWAIPQSCWLTVDPEIPRIWRGTTLRLVTS